MNIVQWNMTSYQANFEELKLLIRETNNPACICLQETRHGERILRPPSGYSIIQLGKRREDECERGVALLINKEIDFKPIALRISRNVEAIAAKIWLGKYYTVCCMYLSPSLNISEAEINEILIQLPEPFLILGDMNARHYMWGEPTQNHKGNIFHKILTEQNLSLLNEEEKTHYSIQNGTSTLIDLSIVSTSAYPDFNASVIECRHGSDHHPIEITKLSPPEVGERALRFKTEKANWEKYMDLTKKFEIVEDCVDIDEQVQHITQFLQEAAMSSMPISTERSSKKPPLPWWDAKCEKVHRERKRAQRALHRNNNLSNAIAYKRLRALCRYTFKKAKETSWKNYTSSINSETSLTEVWKKVKKIKGTYSANPNPLLTKEDGTLTDDPSETTEIMADAYAEISSNDNYSPQFSKHRKTEENRSIKYRSMDDECNTYNQPLTMREMKQAIAAVKESSPGEDAITYSLIKNSHENLKEKLLMIYNKIFLQHTFPDSWKTAVIIPIPKPNKSHSTPQNFRPISLTSCLCKLVEKMINTRLVWFLEKENLISDVQSGFKKNRSTTDCITKVTHEFQDAIIGKKHTIAVFFDLQKAYDTAWKRGILNKIHSFGLRGNLPVFIQNFLQNRKIKVRVGSTLSSSRNLDQGIPQGSVLSCSLFAIAIDDVTSVLPPQVKAALYVDDLTIYASGSTNTAERQIKTALRRLEEWSYKTGFTFSPEKSKIMHICRSRGCLKTLPPLEMYGKPLSTETNINFLGIILDNSLKFDIHLRKTKTECIRRLNLMKFLSGTTWGADSKTLLRIYEALVKSKIEYGSEAYGSASISNLKILNTIQNTALRIATGAYRTSPAISLEAITDTASLSMGRQTNLAKYVVRILCNPRNPMYEIALESIRNEEENVSKATLFHQRSIAQRMKSVWNRNEIEMKKLWSEKPGNNPPWMMTNLNICKTVIDDTKKSIPENVLKTIFNNHLRSHMNRQLTIYTDGSKTKDGVAFSAVGYQQNRAIAAEAKKIPKEASIFTAELYAILFAVQKASKSMFDEVNIISDSKSCLQAIAQIIPKNPLATLIQDRMCETSKIFTL